MSETLLTIPTLPTIRTARDGDVLCLEIHRPDRRNAIDMPMFDCLARELIAANGDETVGAVLLCGAGEGFCAGHDLQAFDTHWPQHPTDPVPRFLHALADLRKPLVIAVQGWAVGIGATGLLHADWVLAAPGAKLRFPFVDLGIAPEAGSTLLLARAIGTPRARRLLLGGEAISAEQALDWGLVAELCPATELRATATERARALAAKPAAMFGRIKSWLAPLDEVHARIDEEVEAINQALIQRRRQPNA